MQIYRGHVHPSRRANRRWQRAKDFANAFEPFLDECAAGEYQKILLDLGGVNFIISDGLRC